MADKETKTTLILEEYTDEKGKHFISKPIDIGNELKPKPKEIFNHVANFITNGMDGVTRKIKDIFTTPSTTKNILPAKITDSPVKIALKKFIKMASAIVPIKTTSPQITLPEKGTNPPHLPGIIIPKGHETPLGEGTVKSHSIVGSLQGHESTIEKTVGPLVESANAVREEKEGKEGKEVKEGDRDNSLIR